MDQAQVSTRSSGHHRPFSLSVWEIAWRLVRKAQRNVCLVRAVRVSRLLDRKI